MTQETHFHRQHWSEISADTFQSSPFSIDTPYGYQLDLDFVKYVDDIERSDTIRRLHFNKRPGVANAASEPQRIINPTHWTSSESLSSVSSDEAKKTSPSSSSSSSSVNNRRPPRPHSKPKSSSQRPEVPQDLVTSQRDEHGTPTPATQHPTPTKSNPLVEKTLMETCRRLEHEKGSSQQGPPEPQPRRRLASFGGLGSTGTLSPYTSWSALNQGAKMTVLDQPRQGTLLLGSGLKISSSSSGRASPVSGVSPLHLQMVRDQMAAALRRLKDLEEQVKAIPVLQVKIAVLQEEKRQLTALVKSQEEAQKSSASIDKDLQELNSKPAMEGWEHSAISGLTDFQQLSVEMQLLERKIQDARLESSAFKMRDRMSVAVGDDRCIDEVNAIHHHKLNFSKDVAVDAKLETQSVAVGVTETMLGVVSDKEAETELQQQTIQHLSDRVQILEAELKEAMLKAEMGRLRSELREAEARNRADKSSSAHPQVNCTATQTDSQTRTLGVGNHTNLVHSAVGGGLEQISIDVEVSCKPEMKVASSGPDTPMKEWEVRKRVEQKDQCVGSKSVATHSQGAGTTVCMCDAATITSETMENKRSISRQTVGCGDCTVDVDVRSVKSQISQGTVTDPVRSVDLGVMAIPQTMSQRTSTAFCTISRSTSTLQACISEASTNTKHTLTRERHTNTAHAMTRSLAVGDGKVCNRVSAVQMHSVGTTACLDRSTSIPAVPNVMTRDVGVGMANINENILIGLHTRNIACGPSCLPDPVKTRSIGIEVGDGRIRDSEGQMFVLTEPGLDHYIDRMQKLLKEQQDLLTDSHPGAKHEAILQSHDVLDKQVGGIAQNQTSYETSKVKEKNQMELQMSAALHGSPSDDRCLRSIIKRRSTNLKSMDSMNPKPASHGGTVDPLFEGGDSEDEEQKKREKREKEGSAKYKGKIPKRKERYKFSEKMLSACQTLEVHLNGSKVISNRELRSCLSTVQQEWFCVSSQKRACPQIVEDFLFACRHVSPDVLCYVANMADQNGNTALHYSVSHSNFSIVKILLAAGICNVDHQNKAGYTPIMLASLAAVETKDDMMVVQELFSRGDVNAKASQAGQTALMLAVSHGHIDMVRALLAAGAEVNIQDDEGSTALMCAGEHGHADIVKLLLAQPGCDATLTDNDESTALSIALEAGHKDIAMLLYAHVNYSKGQPRGSPRSKTPPGARISSSD
ncbi:KN motif and ankyrin repeat domain-containing protein 1-like [Sinocyclocheilus rhinocerous]|uniref:KN motif and ankyrin repeat domain-containing protein 1-like n=1 Tax=Sinocyclocheilus rhinocerous TaxID=307959 RepID=UPI0007B7B5AE|nr:PREDICTED: KN motif and ankyrin repeat domain-containing protein 1-like [Sinocyclocheilus rhinocerous]